MDEEMTRNLFEVALSHGEHSRTKRLTKPLFKQFFRSAGLFDGGPEGSSGGANTSRQTRKKEQQKETKKKPAIPSLSEDGKSLVGHCVNTENSSGAELLTQETMTQIEQNKDQDVEDEGVSNLFLQMLWEQFRTPQGDYTTEQSMPSPAGSPSPTSAGGGGGNRKRPFTFLALMDDFIANNNQNGNGDDDDDDVSPPNVRRQLDMRPATADSVVGPTGLNPKSEGEVLQVQLPKIGETSTTMAGGMARRRTVSLDRAAGVTKQRRERDKRHFLRQEFMQYAGFHHCIQAITTRRYLSIIGRSSTYKLTEAEAEQAVRLMTDQYFDPLFNSACVTADLSMNLRRRENNWAPLTFGLVLKMLDVCCPLFLEAFQDQMNTDTQVLGGDHSSMVLSYKRFKDFLGLYGFGEPTSGSKTDVSFQNDDEEHDDDEDNEFGASTTSTKAGLQRDEMVFTPLVSDEMALAIFSAANTEDTKGMDKGNLSNELEIDEFVQALVMIAMAAFDGHQDKSLAPWLLPPRVCVDGRRGSCQFNGDRRRSTGRAENTFLTLITEIAGKDPKHLPAGADLEPVVDLITIQSRVFAFVDYFVHAHKVLRPSSKKVAEVEAVIQTLRYSQDLILAEEALHPYVGAVEPSKFAIEGEDLLLVAGINFLDVKENPDALKEKKQQVAYRASMVAKALGRPSPRASPTTTPLPQEDGAEREATSEIVEGGEEVGGAQVGKCDTVPARPRTDGGNDESIVWPSSNSVRKKKKQFAEGGSSESSAMTRIRKPTIAAQARKVFSGFVGSHLGVSEAEAGNQVCEPLWVWFDADLQIPGYHQATNRVACNPPMDLLVPSETLNSDQMVFSLGNLKNEPLIPEVHYILDIAPPLVHQPTGTQDPGLKTDYSFSTIAMLDQNISPPARPLALPDAQGFCLGFSLTKFRATEVGVTKSKSATPGNTVPMLLQLTPALHYLSAPHRQLLEEVFLAYKKAVPPVLSSNVTSGGGSFGSSFSAPSRVTVGAAGGPASPLSPMSKTRQVPDAWSLDTFMAFVKDYESALPKQFAIPAFLGVNERAATVPLSRVDVGHPESDSSPASERHHFFDNSPACWEKLFYTFAYNSELLVRESSVAGVPDRAVPAGQVVTNIQTNVFGVALVRHSCPKLRRRAKGVGFVNPSDEEDDGICWTATGDVSTLRRNSSSLPFQSGGSEARVPCGSAGWLLTRSGLLLLLGYTLAGTRPPTDGVKPTLATTTTTTSSSSRPLKTQKGQAEAASPMFPSVGSEYPAFTPSLYTSNASLASPDFESFIVRLLRSEKNDVVKEDLEKYEHTLRQFDVRPSRPPGEKQKHGRQNRQGASESPRNLEFSTRSPLVKIIEKPVSVRAALSSARGKSSKTASGKKGGRSTTTPGRIVQVYQTPAPPLSRAKPPSALSSSAYQAGSLILTGGEGTPGGDNPAITTPEINPRRLIGPRFLEQLEDVLMEGQGIVERHDLDPDPDDGCSPLRNWFKRPKVRSKEVNETSGEVVDNLKIKYLANVMKGRGEE